MEHEFDMQNERTIFLLQPLTVAAKEWIAEHLDDENVKMHVGDAVVVEHRYIADIVTGLRDDGLTSL